MKNKFILLMVLLLSAGLLIVSCSPGISSTEDASQNNTTSDTNSNTPPTPVTTKFTITVTELAATGARPYYVAFSVATNQAAGLVTPDYYFALQKMSAAKPTYTAIKNGLHYQRNISSVPINIYAWAAVDTAYTTPADENAALALMLKPQTEYVLYAVPMNGQDSDVVDLKHFTTSAVPNSASAIDTPVDTSIFNNTTYTVREGENILLLVLAERTSDTFFQGPASSTIKPTSFGLWVEHLRTDSAAGHYLYSIFGQVNSITSNAAGFMFKLGGNDWWFKTTMEAARKITSPALTVNELAKNNGIRSRYVAFSVTTSEQNVKAGDYFFVLKSSKLPKVTASEIGNGLHFQRNVSNSAINIYAWAPVSTRYVTPKSASDARAMMLSPLTEYVLYGMPDGGSDIDVKELGRFSTDDLPPASVNLNLTPVDTSIFNSPVFSLRVGENISLMTTAVVNSGYNFNVYTGVSGTVEPGNTTTYTNDFDPDANLAIFDFFTGGLVTTNTASYLYNFGGNKWWFKTTLDN